MRGLHPAFSIFLNFRTDKFPLRILQATEGVLRPGEPEFNEYVRLLSLEKPWRFQFCKLGTQIQSEHNLMRTIVIAVKLGNGKVIRITDTQLIFEYILKYKYYRITCPVTRPHPESAFE